MLCFVLPSPHTLYIKGIQLLFQFIRTIASRQFHGIICLGFTSWFHNRGSSNLTTALASNCSWQRPIKFHLCQIDNRSQIFNLSLMGENMTIRLGSSNKDITKVRSKLLHNRFKAGSRKRCEWEPLFFERVSCDRCLCVLLFIYCI